MPAGQAADDKCRAPSEPGAALRYRGSGVMVMSVRHSDLLWPWVPVARLRDDYSNVPADSRGSRERLS